MPQTPHIERHFRASDTIRDVVIGMSDGLTVPFALAAGLSGAVSSSHVITTARARRSAATIDGAYVAGGLIPIAPYFMLSGVAAALPWSIAVTLVALALFGYIKGGFTGSSRLRSALQTLLIGGCAAAAAFLLARLIA